MLKKLLLVSLTASALASCGGSIGPSAEDAREATRNAPTPAPAPAPEPTTDCTPEMTQFSFDSEDEVEQWYIDGEGTNVRLSHDPETQSAMLITPLQWSEDDASHQRQARVALDEATNIAGGTVEWEISLPEAYIEDGNLVFQFVMAEPYMDAGWITMTPFAELVEETEGTGQIRWNDLPEKQASASTTITRNPANGRFIVTITAPQGAESVTHVGMQMAQMPSDQTILEPIAVHKVTISELSPAECLEQGEPNKEVVIDFTEEVEFGNDGAVTLSIDEEEEALRVQSDFSDTAQKSIFVVLTEDQLHTFEGATIEYVIDIPQSYIDAGLSLQTFVQQNEGSYTGDWSNGWQDNSALEAGENVLTYNPADIENAARVGFQIHGVDGAPAGDILVREITITYVGGGEADDNTVDVDFTEEVEFGNDGAATLSIDEEEEALRVESDFSDTAQKSIFIILAEDQMKSFDGATIEYVIDIPQSYIDAGLSLQTFVQQNEGSYTGDWSNGWQDNSALEAGENVLTYNPADIENASRVGFQIHGVEGAPEGDLLLRRITIEYAD